MVVGWAVPRTERLTEAPEAIIFSLSSVRESFPEYYRVCCVYMFFGRLDFHVTSELCHSKVVRKALQVEKTFIYATQVDANHACVSRRFRQQSA